MPGCNTTVTTPTGVFTYHEDKVTYCEAKERCANVGQILAPLTSYDDVDALRSVADFKSQHCPFHHGAHDYHIGLDISKCAGKQYKMFTNNVVWNDTLHDDLYRWMPRSESGDTSYARLFAPVRKLFVVSDRVRSKKARFICLKPSASSVAEKIVVRDESFSVFYAGGAVLIALVCFMLVIKVGQLKKENERLKSKMNGLPNDF